MTPIEEVIVNKKSNINPIWIMRQAGRYHSHYQNLKKNYCKFAKNNNVLNNTDLYNKLC